MKEEWKQTQKQGFTVKLERSIENCDLTGKLIATFYPVSFQETLLINYQVPMLDMGVVIVMVQQTFAIKSHHK